MAFSTYYIKEVILRLERLLLWLKIAYCHEEDLSSGPSNYMVADSHVLTLVPRYSISSSSIQEHL